MKRKIIDKEYTTTIYNRPREGRVWCKLECGHLKTYRTSKEPKNYCFCKECD